MDSNKRYWLPLHFVFKVALFITGVCLFGSCTEKIGAVSRVTDGKEADGANHRKEQEDYYDEKHLRYEDHIYQSNIYTVKMHKKGFGLNPPVFMLNQANDGIEMSFDDLDNDLKDYQYSFIHCNADWQPSGLVANEFLEGFFTNPISDYGYSIGVRIPYTHYALTLPNSNVRFTKSGNYLLLIHLDDPEEPVITRRFMIYEKSLRIDTQVKPSSVVNERTQRQEVGFTLYPGVLGVKDPMAELQVMLLQNNRWDNMVSDLQPVFIRENALVYDHNEANVFDGGNEFRWFDTKSLHHKTERIGQIRTDSGEYHVDLLPDKVRNATVYSTMPDINGKFVIRNLQGFDNDKESEYIRMYFQLHFPAPIKEGDLYIFGALSDWKFRRSFRMQYNRNTLSYEANVLLKQGYYNYAYVLLKDGFPGGDMVPVEGNHFATENDYTILVYQRRTTDRYDRLMGVKNFSSRN